MVAPDLTGDRDQAVERWSLPDLKQLQRRLLADSELLARAGRSAVYRKRWRKANFQPGRIADLTDLCNVPFACKQDLLGASHGEGLRQYACSEVALWFRTGTDQEESVWFPCASEDIASSLNHWRRASQVTGIDDADVVLMLTAAAPALSDSFPYFLAYAHKLKGGANVEIIPISLTLLQRKPRWAEFFLSKKMPSVLISTPGDALALAELLQKTEEMSAHVGTASAIGAQADISLRLRHLRLILLYGGRSAAGSNAGGQVDTFRLHGVLDYPLYCVECQMHQGLHVWLDMCIPEIIPVAELDMERSRSGYVPETVLLAEAQSGLRGELVVTTFAAALPLIRFRTNEHVQVIGVEPCGCGRTHPRVIFI